MLNERVVKDLDVTAVRLVKLQSDYENQLLVADTMATENQARVVELKVHVSIFVVLSITLIIYQ